MQGRQFDKVSKLIKVGTEELDLERAGFITALAGFDTHSDGEGLTKSHLKNIRIYTPDVLCPPIITQSPCMIILKKYGLIKAHLTTHIFALNNKSEAWYKTLYCYPLVTKIA